MRLAVLATILAAFLAAATPSPAHEKTPSEIIAGGLSYVSQRPSPA